MSEDIFDIIKAKKKLARQAIIAPWYLRPSQLDIYKLLRTSPNPFVECARRFGKTTSILVYVLERLIENPGWVALWCEPWKNQARDILFPEMEKMNAFFLTRNNFRYRITDSVFVNPNGSRLKIRGINEDRGESARGSFANIIVADEFGSWIDPDYSVNEILRPQLLTTKGQFIFASTPPDDLAHKYYEHKQLALKHDRYVKKTIYDNESLTEEEIERVATEVGGKDSPAFKREYMCEPISDPERLVIPEYKEELHDIPDDYPSPPHFDAYVGFDLGFNDNTFFVFGYYDFKDRCLVLEQELCMSGSNSKQITDKAKAIEMWLWKDKKPYLRISDNDKQQLYDMLTMCDYQALPTRKDDKMAAINALRLRFSQGKIKIKKRCNLLRYQLKVGLWNGRKTDFERGANTGHLDGIDALIYLNRNINESRNPYPLLEGVTKETHWIPEQKNVNDSLKNAFRPLGG
jgi:hypothetical protein